MFVSVHTSLSHIHKPVFDAMLNSNMVNYSFMAFGKIICL